MSQCKALLILFLSSGIALKAESVISVTNKKTGTHCSIAVPPVISGTVNFIVEISRGNRTSDDAWNSAREQAFDLMRKQNDHLFFVTSAELLLELLQLTDCQVQSSINITNSASDITNLLPVLGANSIVFGLQVSRTFNTTDDRWNKVLKKAIAAGLTQGRPLFFAVSAELMLKFFELNACQYQSIIDLSGSVQRVRFNDCACNN